MIYNFILVNFLDILQLFELHARESRAHIVLCKSERQAECVITAVCSERTVDCYVVNIGILIIRNQIGVAFGFTQSQIFYNNRRDITTVYLHLAMGIIGCISRKTHTLIVIVEIIILAVLNVLEHKVRISCIRELYINKIALLSLVV